MADQLLVLPRSLHMIDMQKWWSHYRQFMLTDFVRAGPYMSLLTPPLSIVNYCKNWRMEQEDMKAIECLLDKFFLPIDITDETERQMKGAKMMMDTFLNELKRFQNHTGPYA